MNTENNANANVRQAYETPILFNELRGKLSNDINNSRLMACEILPIVKDIYEEVQVAAQQELQYAIQQKQQETQQEEKDKEITTE
jgi:hypothetical protein